MIELEEFFAGRTASREIFDALLAAVESLGAVTLRVTRSQVAFVQARPFAWAWIPAMYLHRNVAPLVLSLPFRHRHPSRRWKEIYEAKPGRFTHHLELWSPDEVDGEVLDWLREARESQG